MWMAKIWDKCLRVHGCGHVKLGMRAWEARRWGLVQLMPTVDAMRAEAPEFREPAGEEGGAHFQIWLRILSKRGLSALQILLKNF